MSGHACAERRRPTADYRLSQLKKEVYYSSLKEDEKLSGGLLMCQRPSNGKIPNQQGLVLKHKTLCLALILLPIPATGLRNVTGLVPFVDAT